MYQPDDLSHHFYVDDIGNAVMPKEYFESLLQKFYMAGIKDGKEKADGE